MSTTKRLTPSVPTRTVRVERPHVKTPEVDEEPTVIQRGPPARSASPVEVTVVHQRGVSFTTTAEEWIAIEIWTKNHVYMLSGTLVCSSVINRVSGKDDPQHALLGTQLTGGTRRSVERLDVAQPLPFPGMKAVFRHPKKGNGPNRFGETSKVERVVLRLGLTTIDAPDRAFQIEEVTARYFTTTR